MDDYPIRSITADELPAFEEALALAFHGSGIDEHLKDDQLIAEFYTDGTAERTPSTAHSGEFPETD